MHCLALQFFVIFFWYFSTFPLGAHGHKYTRKSKIRPSFKRKTDSLSSESQHYVNFHLGKYVVMFSWPQASRRKLSIGTDWKCPAGLYIAIKHSMIRSFATLFRRYLILNSLLMEKKIRTDERDLVEIATRHCWLSRSSMTTDTAIRFSLSFVPLVCFPWPIFRQERYAYE